MTTKRRRSILSIICIIAALICLALAIREELPYWKNAAHIRVLRQDVITDRKESAPEEKEIDWEKLHKINPDIIAWITVPGTKIDYPILRCPSNSFYLHRNERKEWNALGSIFVQPGTEFTDAHVVLYGHNMKSGQMFGSLHRFEEKSFWKEHQKIYIDTPEKKITAEIYAVYDCQDATKTYQTDFSSAEGWKNWIQYSTDNRYYNTGIIPEAGSRVVTLSTCSNGRGRLSRFVVHGVITSVTTVEEP